MNNKPTPPPGGKPINEEVIQKLLETESRKIELAAKRIDLENANQQRQYDYAVKALDVQKEFLKNKPVADRKKLISVGTISLIGLVILLTFFGYCIYYNKEQIVLQALYYIGTAAIAYAGGFQHGKHKKPKKDNTVELVDDNEQ